MKIVVMGGTGLIGSRLAGKLREDGHRPLVGSPETGVNSLTGGGLHEALRDAQTLVDVTNAPDREAEAVMYFFQTSSRNLLAAVAAAGVAHYVALSVVGTDRLTESGYFRAKLVQEELIATSSIPYSIVRATQFFECMNGIAVAATDGNAIRLPPALIQPVAAGDAAAALARLAVGAPVNGMIEIAGPEHFRVDELIRRLLKARGDPRKVITDPRARLFGIAPGAHALLPAHDARLSQTDFATWLGNRSARSTITRATSRSELTGHPET